VRTGKDGRSDRVRDERSQKPEAKSQKPKAKSQNCGVGAEVRTGKDGRSDKVRDERSQKPEAESQKPEAKSQKPRVRGGGGGENGQGRQERQGREGERGADRDARGVHPTRRAAGEHQGLNPVQLSRPMQIVRGFRLLRLGAI